MTTIVLLFVGYAAGCVVTYFYAVRVVERRQLALLEESRRPPSDFRKTLPEIEIPVQLEEP